MENINDKVKALGQELIGRVEEDLENKFFILISGDLKERPNRCEYHTRGQSGNIAEALYQLCKYDKKLAAILGHVHKRLVKNGYNFIDK